VHVLLVTAALFAGQASAQQPTAPTPYQRAIAAGYKALTLCSGIFEAGRTQEQVEALELRGIYPEYDTIVRGLGVHIDQGSHGVSVGFDPDLPARRADHRPTVGCVLRPIGAADDAIVPYHGPLTQQQPSADPRPWPMGDKGIAPRSSPALTTKIDAAFDQATYGPGSQTIGVVVLRDGKVVGERYRDGFGPFTANRTWSVAKSIAGTLVGIERADVTKPVAIEHWSRDAGDPRSAIKLDDLLRMASGLHGDTAGNRTDAVYFGGTAVEESVTALSLEAVPGTRFRYANNDILLAVLSLRKPGPLGVVLRAGLPDRLFTPLGMEHTVAETDWRGDYILSSQVWSTGRDLARLGQFWLQDGVWQGKRILPEGWMRYMTTPSGPQPTTGPGYGATLWLFGPKQGLPAGSYAAQGNRGQYVMVIPSERLVIVRRGEDPGPARFDIARFAADVIAAR
jgi:CubicO group peptidase (beta-lactamase class C family)